MRNLLLGFLLGSSVAIAADRADDFILTIDVEQGGAVHRRLSFSTHVDVLASDWPAMRTAAGTSQAAFDTWMNTHAGGAWSAWYTGLGNARQAGLRGVVLKGS